MAGVTYCDGNLRTRPEDNRSFWIFSVNSSYVRNIGIISFYFVTERIFRKKEKYKKNNYIIFINLFIPLLEIVEKFAGTSVLSDPVILQYYLYVYLHRSGYF